MTPVQKAGVPYIRLAGFYALYFAGLGSFLPYWPLYLSTLHYEAEAIGLIMALTSMTRLVAPYLWGWLVDHYGAPMRWIRLACAGLLASFLLMAWQQDLQQLVAVTLLYTFFWNAILPPYEGVTLQYLHGNAHQYVRVRLWGSLGFVLGVTAMGELLGKTLAMECLPVVVGMLFLLQWLGSLCVPAPRVIAHAATDAGSVLQRLRRPEVMGLMLVGLLVQMAHGPYYSFFSLHLSHYGYSDAGIGQLWTLGVMAEVVLFIFLPRLQPYTSLRFMLLLALLLSIARWLLVAWATGSFVLLVTAQALHAAAFGATHAVAIQLIHHYFPGKLHSRGQALYSSICYGIGGAAGSMLSGEYWERFGPEWIFSAAALASLLALVIAWWMVERKMMRKGDESMGTGDF